MKGSVPCFRQKFFKCGGFEKSRRKILVIAEMWDKKKRI